MLEMVCSKCYFKIEVLKIYKIIGKTCNFSHGMLFFTHAVRHTCFIYWPFAEKFPHILRKPSERGALSRKQVHR